MSFCAICLKHADIGHLVSHAKNRVRHLRKANLHTAHITVDGVSKRVKLCTHCKRDMRMIDRVADEKAAKKKGAAKSGEKTQGARAEKASKSTKVTADKKLHKSSGT